MVCVTQGRGSPRSFAILLFQFLAPSVDIREKRKRERERNGYSVSNLSRSPTIYVYTYLVKWDDYPRAERRVYRYADFVSTTLISSSRYHKFRLNAEAFPRNYFGLAEPLSSSRNAGGRFPLRELHPRRVRNISTFPRRSCRSFRSTR